LNESEVRASAKVLAEAERTKKAVPPLTEAYPEMTAKDAYQVQRFNVMQRVESGRSVRGHKIGLTAKAMQDLFGVYEPDYGHLLDDMFIPESTAVAIDRFISPRIEIESAFILGRPLRGPGITIADAIRAIEYVLPSIEIIDSRIEDWRIKLADTIADNGSSSAVVLGGRPTRLADVDLRNLAAEMSIDGEVVESGNTSAVLGNPISALAWLANTVGNQGVELKEGDVVLPGSCIRAVPATRGITVRGKFEVLGDVCVEFI
jgi:2-keto-4-pentenoate hydratase